MTTETKACFELKEVTEDGVIEGYAAIFNNVDRGMDKLLPGAFTKGLAAATRSKRKIKMLWQHRSDEPIGVWDELVEDARGLKVKGHLTMDVGRARETLALMRDEVIDSLSIGYQTVKSIYEGDVRVLQEVALYEVSPVTFPMNEKAKISSIKADIEDVVKKLKAGDRLTEREFERMAKGLGCSNSEAERAARIHRKGQGEPAKAANDVAEFLAAFRA